MWYRTEFVLLLIQSYLGIPLQIWAKKTYDQWPTFWEKRPQSGLIDPFLADFDDFSSFLAIKSPRSDLTDSVHYIYLQPSGIHLKMPKLAFLGAFWSWKLAFFLENRCISPLLAPLMFNDLTKNTFKYDFLMNSYFNHIVLTSKNSFRRELKKGLKLCFNCFRAHSERVVTRGLNQITRRIWGILSNFCDIEQNSFSF